MRTGKKACCFLLAVLRVDWPHCMDHPARWQVKAPAAHQLCRCALLEPQQSLHISSHEHVSLAKQTEGKGCISTACTCGAQAVESAAMDV